MSLTCDSASDLNICPAYTFADCAPAIYNTAQWASHFATANYPSFESLRAQCHIIYENCVNTDTTGNVSHCAPAYASCREAVMEQWGKVAATAMEFLSACLGQ